MLTVESVVLPPGGRIEAEKQKVTRISLTLALVGIVLSTLTTRSGYTALSPVFDQIALDLHITPFVQSILGMLPALAFGISGWFAPQMVRKLGLEKILLFAMIIIFGGLFARSFSNDAIQFGILYAISLTAMGATNGLLPAVIKRYFPNHIGPVSSLFTTMISLSASLPALVAMPLTMAYGWRISTGLWAGLALLAIIPWLRLSKAETHTARMSEIRLGAVWHWPMAWAIMIIFSIGAFNIFAMISWLPKILVSEVGVSPSTAGTMLSLFLFSGFFTSMISPIILVRTKYPYLVIAAFSTCFVVGYLGLMYLPAFVWLWVTLIGLGLTFIPISLTLINMRSRSSDGATALSGFVQGLGYIISALGPFIIGGLHTISGEWKGAIWFLVFLALLAIPAGIFVSRKYFLEDAQTNNSK
jgi:CP family cyanate transporter-like MFS transporter